MNYLVQIIEKLFCWMPRIALVNPDEAGVRITGGSRYTDVGPGWYLYVPMIQDVQVVTVTPQVVDLRPQSLLTADSVDMTVSGAVRYRIKDASNALLKVQDFDKSIQTLGLGIVGEVVRASNSTELTAGFIEEKVAAGLQREAWGWGIDVMKIYTTDLGRCQNFRLLPNDTFSRMIFGDE